MTIADHDKVKIACRTAWERFGEKTRAMDAATQVMQEARHAWCEINALLAALEDAQAAEEDEAERRVDDLNEAIAAQLMA